MRPGCNHCVNWLPAAFFQEDPIEDPSLQNYSSNFTQTLVLPVSRLLLKKSVATLTRWVSEKHNADPETPKSRHYGVPLALYRQHLASHCDLRNIP